MPRTTAASEPAISLDVVVFTIRDDELCVVLQKRGEAPLKGRLQLPGAALADPEQLTVQASGLVRGLFDLNSHAPDIRQLRTYGAIRRDPRGPVLSIAWWLALPIDLAEAGDLRVVRVADIDSLRLAFDQAQVVHDAAEELAERIQFSNVATRLCPEPFSMAELRRVFEVIWQVDLDPANFHRKATSVDGLVEPTGHQSVGGPGRPALLYRGGPPAQLSNPITRPRA